MCLQRKQLNLGTKRSVNYKYPFFSSYFSWRNQETGMAFLEQLVGIEIYARHLISHL